MIRTLDQLFDSKSWLALSVGCSLFALYEGIEKLIAGDAVEGILDFVLMAVLLVNLANRSRGIVSSIRKLRP